MSTEFRTEDTDQFAFIRWAGPDTVRGFSQNFDFGNVSHAMQVMEWCQQGVRFVGEDGQVFEGRDVFNGFMGTRQVPGCRPGEPVVMVVTFGEFGGTFEVGSGESFDRSGF